MHITWHSGFTIKIQSDDKTLVIDPSGLRGKADLVALSSPTDKTMSDVKNIQDEYVLLDKPGEYEVAGFALHALGYLDEDGNEHNLQRWNIEGMTLLHVGNLQRELTEAELDALEKVGIDVLFVPVGDLATKLVTTVEPRYVIPINYEGKGVESFAKEMGAEVGTPEKKLILKAGKLPQDETIVTILSPA